MFFGWGDLSLRLRHNWRLLFAILVPLITIPIACLSEPNLENLSVSNTGGSKNIFYYEVTDDDNVTTRNIRHAMNAMTDEGDPNKKFRAAYVITLMALFWVFEVLPLAVTSLFPLVLFPLLGVQEACAVSKNYMKESNMIFLGAIIIALSIEYCGLHKRGALRVISIFGARPPRIMLGTMIITAALSMWLSDTSCTTMILPILTAITAAMFQEEQADTIAEEDDDIEEAEIDMSRFRQRRVSTVFANSAMQSVNRQGSLRRRRKKSMDAGALGLGLGLDRPMSLAALRLNRPRGSGQENIRNTISHLSPHISFVISDEDGMEVTDHGDDPPPRRSEGLKSLRDSGTGGILESIADEPEEEAEEEEKNDEIKDETKEDTNANQLNKVEIAESTDSVNDEENQSNIRKMLLFAVAYSANIGGTGSLVGTGPIKVFKELNKQYLNKDVTESVHVSFATWMAFTIPPLVVNIGIVWLFLTIRYYGVKNLLTKTSETSSKREREKVREYLSAEFKRLGNITSHEVGVLAVFVVVVLLWLSRDPQIFPGWDYLISSSSKSKTGDSTPAMFAAILLFIIPKKWNFLDFKKPYRPGFNKYEALLDWKFVSTNAPWGYVLLIGSGYAIADASEKSGLSKYIGGKLELLDEYLSDQALLLIVIIITSVITEVVSNTACATLLLPTLFSLSCKTHLHPSYLTMAAAISASYAFLLPISSPPNAIVFATGELSIREMIMNGFFLNVVCTAVVYFAYITYGEFIFHFSKHNHGYECQTFSLC